MQSTNRLRAITFPRTRLAPVLQSCLSLQNCPETTSLHASSLSPWPSTVPLNFLPPSLFSTVPSLRHTFSHLPTLSGSSFLRVTHHGPIPFLSFGLWQPPGPSGRPQQQDPPPDATTSLNSNHPVAPYLPRDYQTPRNKVSSFAYQTCRRRKRKCDCKLPYCSACELDF